MLNYITQNSWVGKIEFYADHEVDSPQFQPQILALELNPVCVEVAGDENEVVVEVNATEVNVNADEENEVVGDVNAEADVVNEEEVNAHQVNENEAPINENADAGRQFSYNNTEGVGCREEDVNTTYVHPNGYISEGDKDGQIDETNESDSTDLSDQDEEDAYDKQSCNLMQTNLTLFWG